jgi:hypothetical protein
MNYLNKLGPGYKPIPITHKCDDDRIGKVMTKEELHQFGMDLLITYLFKQNGKFLGVNDNIGNDYPHLVVKNPDNELLYIWVRTDIFPTFPEIESIGNLEEVVKLSAQFKASPVFAGIRFKCVSTDENSLSTCGADYNVEFMGLKKIILEEPDYNNL